jgi:hypothetical protein
MDALTKSFGTAGMHNHCLGRCERARQNEEEGIPYMADRMAESGIASFSAFFDNALQTGRDGVGSRPRGVSRSDVRFPVRYHGETLDDRAPARILRSGELLVAFRYRVERSPKPIDHSGSQERWR